MNQSDFYIGQTLDNGALVIAAKRADGEYVVLALTHGTDSAAVHDPYVTWAANKEHGTFWGHYFDNIADAVEDFGKR